MRKLEKLGRNAIKLNKYLREEFEKGNYEEVLKYASAHPLALEHLTFDDLVKYHSKLVEVIGQNAGEQFRTVATERLQGLVRSLSGAETLRHILGKKDYSALMNRTPHSYAGILRYRDKA